jgi:hypothetical protein
MRFHPSIPSPSVKLVNGSFNDPPAAPLTAHTRYFINALNPNPEFDLSLGFISSHNRTKLYSHADRQIFQWF